MRRSGLQEISSEHMPTPSIYLKACKKMKAGKKTKAEFGTDSTVILHSKYWSQNCTIATTRFKSLTACRMGKLANPERNMLYSSSTILNMQAPTVRTRASFLSY